MFNVNFNNIFDTYQESSEKLRNWDLSMRKQFINLWLWGDNKYLHGILVDATINIIKYLNRLHDCGVLIHKYNLIYVIKKPTLKKINFF